MHRKKDTLLNYKKEIRKKFEVEQKGDFASFLLNPSRALLRELCVQRLKNNTSKEDLKTFSIFFGFEFEPTSLNKLKANTDKFRPIENFLKEETDLSQIEGINLAAILVDYQPRPYLKYDKSDIEFDEKLSKESQSATENSVVKISLSKIQKSNLKKKIGIGVLAVLGIFSVGYTSKNLIFPTKQCMQWQINQYENVDCDIKGIVNFNEVIPVDEHQLNLKKIEVDSNTVFFKGKKVMVFYCKVNDKPEYFNQIGTHPETGQVLKEVTPYIINKYVKKIKN